MSTDIKKLPILKYKDVEALLTSFEVQTLLGVNRTTLYRLISECDLPAYRLGKRDEHGIFRFKVSEIQEWLKKAKVMSKRDSSAQL